MQYNSWLIIPPGKTPDRVEATRGKYSYCPPFAVDGDVLMMVLQDASADKVVVTWKDVEQE